jgi:dephospho-CoA kinase
VIAVTGGAAEGKSTVLKIVAGHGFRVVSSDEIVADLWEDHGFRVAVQETLAIDGEVSKEKVRENILTFPHQRRLLNSISHRFVLDALLASQADFAEVPLLIEAALVPHFESVWVVTCGENEQRRRLNERFSDASQVERLLATQTTFSVRQAFADEIIRTNCDLERVEMQIHESLRKNA